MVGEASDGREAVTLTQALDPDVVMMDIRMPVLDGHKGDRAAYIGGTRAKVLMLTTYGLDEYVYAALRAGAAGFMLKTEPPARLCEAVHVVAAGDALLGSETTRLLIERYLSTASRVRPASRLDGLTTREQEVLLEMARGRSNEEIGRASYSIRIWDGRRPRHPHPPDPENLPTRPGTSCCISPPMRPGCTATRQER